MMRGMLVFDREIQSVIHHFLLFEKFEWRRILPPHQPNAERKLFFYPHHPPKNARSFGDDFR